MNFKNYILFLLLISSSYSYAQEVKNDCNSIKNQDYFCNEYIKDVFFKDINVINSIESVKNLNIPKKIIVEDYAKSWKNEDLNLPWIQGNKGDNTNIIVVDDFLGYFRLYGTFDGVMKSQLHGQWTKEESSIIAPNAIFTEVDFNNSSGIVVNNKKTIVNASYGAYGLSTLDQSKIDLGALNNNLILNAKNNNIVLVKAAGNYSVPVDGAYQGYLDYFNIKLRGINSVIFVGALNNNGTVKDKASMAFYSNTAGTDPEYQKQFLVVGVNNSITGLYGTSFAAPIITGYAAILSSKFTNASSEKIAERLLETARKDTVLDYTPSIYGRGEASLSRALAPNSIK